MAAHWRSSTTTRSGACWSGGSPRSATRSASLDGRCSSSICRHRSSTARRRSYVDAPWHFNSQIRGERAQTIDELPLEWFLSRGVVIDMSAKDDGEPIEVADIRAGLKRAGHELAALDIVLVRTGRDAYLAELDYMARGPAVTVEATVWLYEQGVRVMGIDAWGWDGPLHFQAEAAKRADAPGVFWAAHQADLPYSQIERLCNLDALPPTGFQVACFPLKIVGAGAAPARVVALVPG
jgi:kynurenine formamidase